MPRFAYRAVNPAGLPVTGELDAATREDAVTRLRDAGNFPLSVAAASAPAARSLGLRRPRRIGRPEVLLLTRSLATLLKAGVLLDAALDVVGRLAAEAGYRDFVLGLRAELRGGDTFAAVLERRPDLFPDYYVGLVRAGEASARLDDVMRELADLLQRLDALAARIRAALVYPAVLLVVAMLSILALLVGVLPRFAELIQSSGAELSGFTRLILDLGVWLEANGREAAAIAILVLLGLYPLLRRPGFRQGLLERLWRLPALSAVRRDSDAARVARTLGVLLRGGLPLLNALEIAQASAAAPAFRAGLRDALTALRQGRALADALSACRLVPEMMIQLVAIGERSGRLVEMLLETANILEEGVTRSTDRFLALLVPGLTIVAGGIVALVVGSMMSALTSIYAIAS